MRKKLTTNMELPFGDECRIILTHICAGINKEKT